MLFQTMTGLVVEFEDVAVVVGELAGLGVILKIPQHHHGEDDIAVLSA